jgi:hypothetical protein
MSPRAAKRRAAVLLADGRIGHLIYWPPAPREPRDLAGRHGRRTRGRTRARVMLDDGRTLTLPIRTLTIMEPSHGA